MRKGLLQCAALVLALASGCAPEAPSEATPPNLLLVTVDTLRADRLGCYGGPPESGQALCRLFEEGIRYRWAFSTAPYTAPSIASLLTSRYPAYHGVTQAATSYLDAPVTTVAEVLRKAGYTTAAFISNPVLDRSRQLGQGFEVYDQTMTRKERNRPGFAEREAAATTDAALAFAQAGLAEPWFLWVHYQDPHGPYEPPGTDAGTDPPDAAALPTLTIQSGKGGIPAYQVLPGLRALASYERRYLDEIEYLDPHLDRLVRSLDALGRRPAILLTADHGEAFGEDDYYFAHGHSLGLDQIRVPLFYRPAEPGAAREVATPVSLIDVAPTLLALAGRKSPPGYQGRTLPGTDPATMDAPERALFAEHGRRAAVIQQERFYSRDRLGTAEEGRALELGQELPWFPPRTFDLTSDGALGPYQDLSADASEPLEAPLADFLRRTRDRTGVRHDKVSQEIEDRMRALGYVE